MADRRAMDEPTATPQQLQASAHARGRICKMRDCKICAPLREERRRKKAQRKADAQARLHAKGTPCGKTGCVVPACVEGRRDAVATAGPGAPDRVDPPVDPEAARRRQADRHRAGLPCGLETCSLAGCVEGFAQQRVRRHRAGRPCKAADCTNPICVSRRSTT